MRSIETTAAKLSVFKMTWPIFIEILLQMMVGNVDQFMLSHYSQKSVAAVGNANQIINIVIIALSVISMAATILIAQYRGAGNKEKCHGSLYCSSFNKLHFRTYHQFNSVLFRQLLS